MTSERWTVPATPEHASAVRREAVRFAAAHAVLNPPIDDLRLALAEAVNNTVVHAYAGAPVGHVTVTIDVDAEAREVRVCVADRGRGMAPRGDSPGMGLGLPLMSTLAGSVAIHRSAESGGTEVAMTFPLDAPAVLN